MMSTRSEMAELEKLNAYLSRFECSSSHSDSEESINSKFSVNSTPKTKLRRSKSIQKDIPIQYEMQNRDQFYNLSRKESLSIN